MKTAALLVLALGAGLPLVALAVELARVPSGWSAWQEADRITGLAWGSLLLAAGTVAVTLPVGTAGAFLLFRTDLPGRGLWRFLALLGLFVPLPLLAAAWKLAHGWLTHSAGSLEGMGPAVLVHTAAALPWVVVLVGVGLSGVEPELEEDALTVLPAWRVVVAVTLRRAAPTLGLAALACALFPWNEVAVADYCRVRTFGEEVNLQFVSGGEGEVARAVAVALPPVALAALGTLLVVRRWRRTLPAALALRRPARVFRLGRWRWPLATLTAVATAVLFGLPLGGLVWKAGLRYATAAQPGPPTWEAALVLERVAQEARDQRALLVDTAVLALTVGALTAGLALPLAWLARKSGRWEWGVWGLAAVLAAAPGPVLGVGLLDAFQLLFALPGGGLLKPLLYSRPSPLPNVWICTLRVGPLALAALWPRVRLVPRELEEVAALDGVGPAGFVARVLLRLLAGPVAWAALAAGVLAVGELSGGKLVTTPGYLPLAQHVFQMLHAGTDTSLAALCLLWLTLAAAGGAAAAWLAPRGGSR